MTQLAPGTQVASAAVHEGDQSVNDPGPHEPCGGELAPAALAVDTAPAGDSGSPTVESPAIARLRNRGRALRLESALKLRTTIDETGRLGDRVEIVYERLREPPGALLPIAVRVGRDVCDEEMLAQGGILRRFRRYNAVLSGLRPLAERLANLPSHGRSSVTPAEDSGGDYHLLLQLDASIAHRQSIHMARNVVLLDTLVHEITYLERCEAEMTHAITKAESTLRVPEPSPQAVRDRWRARDTLSTPGASSVPSPAWTATPVPASHQAPAQTPAPTPSRESAPAPGPTPEPALGREAESLRAATPMGPHTKRSTLTGGGWMSGIMERVQRRK